MFQEHIITDGAGEQIKIVHDGDRFALVKTDKVKVTTSVTILNRREAMEGAAFIYKEAANDQR